MSTLKSVTALLLLLLASGTAAAQNAEPTISPAKHDLIRGLYSAMKVDQMAQQSANLIMDQMNKQLPSMLAQLLGDSLELRGKPREEFDRALIESSERVNARIKELLPQRIRWAETMEQIYYPIYDKHFTEQELKDLLAFYTSPTGQKAIQLMPDLLKESMEKAAEIINPRLMRLINQVLDEEKQHIGRK
ncbi:MAG TPA: DUF2059 domain-containing protein [Blastocatellia bacterium]|nr:DUF2059 domain-containing protein [Blastocatellia bacterium]